MGAKHTKTKAKVYIKTIQEVSFDLKFRVDYRYQRKLKYIVKGFDFMAKVQMVQEFKFKGRWKAVDVASILEIEVISAKELLDGRIAFTQGELQKLADFKGVALKELMKV